MSTPPKLRCAVYTRKSSEEGLDQEFNSLDAQREACAAFIASQAGLGWKLVPHPYDDGGISGGTMERPALQRLLREIRERRIDVVVVYKIDRLTRSLMDFARIVEVFDAHGVSFVSVTQQFNTTTSMGRLTLNVLLSFAQFEREVTAERIRDKIAASKKKGMWMGGVVPLGYRVENRRLVVDEEEALTVRRLFCRYLDLKSVRALAEEASADGLSRRILRRRNGQDVVSRPFGRGNLYHLLSNPLYIGKIRHRDQLYDGEHEAIIAVELFEQVQALLAAQAPARASRTNTQQSHLLTGLLFDENGERLRPVHANKKGRRYRYYVSRQFVEGRKNGAAGWRLPAHEIESLVEQQLADLLSDRPRLADWIQEGAASATELAPALERAEHFCSQLSSTDLRRKKSLMQQVLRTVAVSPGCVSLEVDRAAVVQLLLEQTDCTAADEHRPSIVRIDCPFTMKRRGVEARIVLTNGKDQNRTADPALVDLVLRAQSYLHQLTDGSNRTITDVAVRNRTPPSEVSRILPFAYLSPRLVEMILTGSQPIELTAQRMSRITDFPLSWSKQDALLAR